MIRFVEKQTIRLDSYVERRPLSSSAIHILPPSPAVLHLRIALLDSPFSWLMTYRNLFSVEDVISIGFANPECIKFSRRRTKTNVSESYTSTTGQFFLTTK